MTALHRAVKKGNLAVARVLLGMGATIDLSIRRCSRRVCGDFSHFWRMEQTALHLAVQNGHETVAILLLEPGASIDKLSTETRGIGRNDDIYEIEMRKTIPMKMNGD